MAWLDDNPPRRSQFRRPRRARVRPVIVGHTSESPWPSSNALGVARFIRDRSDAGSYHHLVDDTRVIDLVDRGAEAYHDGTGSNPWSYGIAAACRTVDWARMPAAVRARFLVHLAVAAARCNAHSVAAGAGRIEPRQISRAQSQAGVSGFIPHGARDPGRRTDWGTTSSAQFPWAEFFTHYRRAVGQPVTPPPTDPTPPPKIEEPPTMMFYREHPTRGYVWCCDHAAGTRRHIQRAELDLIVVNGGARHQGGTKAGWQPPLADMGTLHSLRVVA